MRHALLLAALLALPLAGCAGDAPPQHDAKNDERVAALERRVASLERGAETQAQQLRCFEGQRAMRAAWYEHDRVVLAWVSAGCSQVGGICSDTGLPVGTFEAYRGLVSQVVGAADAPFDIARARMEKLPKVPLATVPSARYTSIRETRASAESATGTYFSACNPLDAAPTATGASSAPTASAAPSASAPP